MKTIISGGSIPPAVGPFSPAVKAGGFLFLSGQVPMDENGNVTGGIAEQTEKVLQSVKRVLDEAGASLDDVVSVTVYLSDANDWPDMNEVYRKFFPKDFPARTTVEAGLFHRGKPYKIEVQAVAYID